MQQQQQQQEAVQVMQQQQQFPVMQQQQAYGYDADSEMEAGKHRQGIISSLHFLLDVWTGILQMAISKVKTT